MRGKADQKKMAWKKIIQKIFKMKLAMRIL